jgi:hypothetical protein
LSTLFRFAARAAVTAGFDDATAVNVVASNASKCAYVAEGGNGLKAPQRRRGTPACLALYCFPALAAAASG